MAMPGPMEMGVILLIVVIVFGAKKLPSLGKGLGEAIKNFKTSVTDDSDTNKIDKK